MAKRTNDNPATGPTIAAADTAIDRVDQSLVASALDKQRIGEKPNRAELSALRRWHKERDERERWQHYRTIPQRDWIKMSGGRQWKILREQSERYGIPFGEAEIDLPAVVRALHDFLAANRHKLAGASGDDPLLAGVNSPALERYRSARAKLAELDLQERENQLLPLDKVHDALSRLGSIMRLAGETLQRQFGPDALAIIDDALNDYESAIDKWIRKLKPPAELPTR